MGDAGIGAVAVHLGLMAGDLIVRRRLHDHAPFGVNDAGEGVCLLGLVAEDSCQHLDHVGVGVVVIVKKNEMVERLMDGFGSGAADLVTAVGGGAGGEGGEGHGVIVPPRPVARLSALDSRTVTSTFTLTSGATSSAGTIGRFTMATPPPLGVILTGGMGTRLQPLTPDLPKAMVPLLNRPLIAYGLDLLAGMGLRELVVVVGGSDEQTGPCALEHTPPRTTVSLAVQLAPNGPGDAVASVGDALNARPVVVLAVDTVLRGADLRDHLDAFIASGAAAWLPLAFTDRPKEMGIAEIDGDRIVTLEEKPQEPRSNLACIGLWLLAPEAVERVRRNSTINSKGESDLTGTIATMLNEGAHIGGRSFAGQWLDCGSLVGLLQAQSALLEDVPPMTFAASGSAAHGEVRTESLVHVAGSELRGPVLLGEDVEIEDCVLGPEVVIGAGARLRGVRLEHALVAPGAQIEGGEHAAVVVTTKGAIVSAG